VLWNPDRFALLRRELHNPPPALGGLYHASDRRDIVGLQHSRDHSVSGDHEVFDEFSRTIFCLLLNADNFIVENYGAGFNGFDVQGAMPIPLIPECLRIPVLQL
jgi:hypothetical protein